MAKPSTSAGRKTAEGEEAWRMNELAAALAVINRGNSRHHHVAAIQVVRSEVYNALAAPYIPATYPQRGLGTPFDTSAYNALAASYIPAAYCQQATINIDEVLDPLNPALRNVLARIITQPSASAQQTATAACQNPDPTTLTFWTDSSFPFVPKHREKTRWAAAKLAPTKHACGLAIAWDLVACHTTSASYTVPTDGPAPAAQQLWQASHRAWQVTGLPHNDLAELRAIAKALEQALAMVGTDPRWKVRVFTDCKAALWNILGENWRDREHRDGGAYWVTRDRLVGGMKGEIMEVLRKLRMAGREVELNWVPGHVGVVGNEMVDTLSKKARAVDCGDMLGLGDTGALEGVKELVRSDFDVGLWLM
ncbi:hypothetical protein B0T19DRAFT_469104 [Cercophora scortea]|uniref:ribonuclease H n=1 Tax=Cercophora scortea TaxID=314031 RepID=A0AAE0I2X1_9PEZI|nr:hypothetical protein B0T19DRAFT_469104 [Cercophora scortea]